MHQGQKGFVLAALFSFAKHYFTSSCQVYHLFTSAKISGRFSFLQRDGGISKISNENHDDGNDDDNEKVTKQ